MPTSAGPMEKVRSDDRLTLLRIVAGQHTGQNQLQAGFGRVAIGRRCGRPKEVGSDDLARVVASRWAACRSQRRFFLRRRDGHRRRLARDQDGGFGGDREREHAYRDPRTPQRQVTLQIGRRSECRGPGSSIHLESNRARPH